ncbi:MAG: hypothetical protein ACREIH_05960 [Nitrospiraceae bacterium]
MKRNGLLAELGLHAGQEFVLAALWEGEATSLPHMKKQIRRKILR